MRSQACTIQQALTPDAAAVVKQAVALAKRRGHAQVTPLHVAHTMLAASSGLLRAACLQSHSVPLQCRALELCFNVALNRLPTSTSGPMLGPHSGHHHHHHPTIANALVAAFKRAQAHQRRGSIENQQQPLLAVKIELEQLIISILDDPSVSRVMREAGFSSTLVKGKVEQAVSVELGSQNQPPNNNNIITKPKDITTTNNIISPNNSCGNLLSMAKPRPSDHQGGFTNNDVMSVIDSLMSKKKKNSVVVGECIETLEGLVREVMDRVEKGSGHVPEGLKEVKFIPVSLSSFGHLSREEVEQRVRELKCLVKSCCVDNNKGVILYLDDLKWANEFRASSNNSNSNNILVDQYQPRSFYCPIEHMIMEIGKLVMGYAECGKLWLLGIATFQTYMRCKSGQPSLEAIWGLHAITIPAGGLGLSLIPDSDLPSPLTSKKAEISGTSWLMLEGGGGGCGADNYRPSATVNIMEARSRQSSGCNSDSTTSSLPSWLQQYKDENTKRASNSINNDQDSVPVKDLCKRWSSICTSTTPLSQTPSSSPSFERTLSFSSISPSSSTSNFSYDQHFLKLHPTHQSFEPKNFWVNEPSSKTSEPTFTMYIQEHNKEHPQQRHTPFISSNPSSTPTSTSSSEMMDQMESQCALPRFKEYNAENLKTLCNALEQKVPHQKDIIFDIATTILHCRSGMAGRKGNNHVLKNNEQGIKEETWLFFQGADMADAKEKIARELARLVFGSQDKFVSIALSSFSSTRADSSEDSRNKRLRDEQSCSYIERFAEAVSRDPHRVFFVEDIEQVDYSSQIGIKKAIERGRIPKYSSEEDVSFGDAIIILSCEIFSSRSRACSPSTLHKIDATSPHEDDPKKITSKGDCASIEEIISPSISLDLNISINDDDDDDDIGNAVQDQSMDEIGLLATVDRCIVFKNQLEL